MHSIYNETKCKHCKTNCHRKHAFVKPGIDQRISLLQQKVSNYKSLRSNFICQEPYCMFSASIDYILLQDCVQNTCTRKLYCFIGLLSAWQLVNSLFYPGQCRQGKEVLQGGARVHRSVTRNLLRLKGGHLQSG